MRLAYFSPLAPVTSDISKYSEELLPYLAKYAAIDIFIDDYIPTNPLITNAFNIYNYLRYYEKAGEYDLTLYHLGNSQHCRYLYPFVFNYPGIGVLHDRSLFQPTNQYMIDASQAVVVPNQYELEQVQAGYPQKPAIQIPMYICKNNLVSDSEKTSLRAEFGFSSEKCILVSFGDIYPSNRVHICLRAIARLIKDFPYLRYILVGECGKNYDVIQYIQSLRLENYVYITGPVDNQVYLDIMQIADICIHLRYPTIDETTDTLLQFFAAGIPAIVSNYRHYAEYPNECCLKVDVDPHEEYDLFQTVKRLITNKALRNQYGNNAQKYITENCTLEQIGFRYIAFLENILRERSKQRGTLLQRNGFDIIQHITEEADKLQISPMQNLVMDELLPLL